MEESWRHFLVKVFQGDFHRFQASGCYSAFYTPEVWWLPLLGPTSNILRYYWSIRMPLILFDTHFSHDFKSEFKYLWKKTLQYQLIFDLSVYTQMDSGRKWGRNPTSNYFWSQFNFCVFKLWISSFIFTFMKLINQGFSIWWKSF